MIKSQNEEFFELLMTILTPLSLTIDYPRLELIFSQDVFSIVEIILGRLVESKRFLSSFKAKRVNFRNYQNSQKSHSAVFKIQQRNAENLISLEINTLQFDCESTLTFSNLQNLFIHIPLIAKFRARFLVHSFYKSINLYNHLEDEFFCGKQYFKLSHASDSDPAADISSLIYLVKKSECLAHLSFNPFIPCQLFSAFSPNELEDFKLAVCSLKNLKSFESLTEFNPADFFHKGPSLNTLKLSNLKSVQWPSLGKVFPHLKPAQIGKNSVHFWTSLKLQRLDLFHCDASEMCTKNLQCFLKNWVLLLL